MEVGYKKALLNIAYYSMITLAIAFSILFMIAMPLRGVAMYQQIVYYIWAILLIATLVLDIVASSINNLKFIVGLIIAGLVFLCLVMGIIVYAGMSVNGVIPYFAGERFALVIAFSVALSILSIVIFCVGQRLIDLKVERRGK